MNIIGKYEMKDMNSHKIENKMQNNVSVNVDYRKSITLEV